MVSCNMVTFSGFLSTVRVRMACSSFGSLMDAVGSLTGSLASAQCAFFFGHAERQMAESRGRAQRPIAQWLGPMQSSQDWTKKVTSRTAV
jgi:hypothetical protein